MDGGQAALQCSGSAVGTIYGRIAHKLTRAGASSALTISRLRPAGARGTVGKGLAVPKRACTQARLGASVTVGEVGAMGNGKVGGGQPSHHPTVPGGAMVDVKDWFLVVSVNRVRVAECREQPRRAMRRGCGGLPV